MTNSDREWVAQASLPELQEEFRRLSPHPLDIPLDREYAQAIAKEILKRFKQEKQANEQT